MIFSVNLDILFFSCYFISFLKKKEFCKFMSFTNLL